MVDCEAAASRAAAGEIGDEEKNQEVFAEDFQNQTVSNVDFDFVVLAVELVVGVQVLKNICMAAVEVLVYQAEVANFAQ